MPSTRLNAKKHRNGEAGFSLAEAIVSAGLLTVSSVALISVFTSSVESVKNISSRDAIAAAINADLAKTQRLNDDYTCFPGSCSIISIDQSPPDKYDYALTPPVSLKPLKSSRCSAKTPQRTFRRALWMNLGPAQQSPLT